MRAIESLCVLAVALLVSACNVIVAGPVVPLAPRGVHVRPDVALGYEAYADALSAWGTWEPDGQYGVRWCPREDAVEPGFSPYASRGHWALSETPIGRSPAGSPVWISEDSDTWGAITTRHGWWVHGRQWCWIPGAEETAARVVWRWGDGFVGWAAEAPDCASYDDVEYEALEWAFTLLGTLLDEALDRNQLDGEARDAARRATAPARAPGAGPVPSPRVGPPAKSIDDARKALHRYAEAHVVTLQQAARIAAAAKGSSGSSGSSSSSDASAGKSSSSKQKKSEPLITAGVYYDVIMANPVLLADASLPQLSRQVPASVPRYSAADIGAAGSALTNAREAAPFGHAGRAASPSFGHAGRAASPSSGHAGRATSVGAAHVAAPSASRARSSASYTYRPSGGSSRKSSGRSSSNGRSSSRSSSRSSGRSHR